MAEYVQLTKNDFTSLFEAQKREFQEVTKPRVRELLFRLPTQKKNVSVLVYSSLDAATGISRGVGEDAIRLVLWDDLNDHPLGKGKRIYRVTSAESVAQRIGKTLTAMCEYAELVNVIDWDYARAVLRETVRIRKSDFATSLLESATKFGKLTDRQIVYVLGTETPNGKPTFEASLKKSGWVYDPTFEEEIVEVETEEEKTQEEIAPHVAGKYDHVEVIKDDPDRPLVPTAEYSPHQYRFDKFNPVQSMVFPYRDEDSNLVIGANTSAGKTICAELAMDAVLKSGKRVIYLSPLKSLTQEKYDDWKVRFAGHPISILTGDYTLSEKKKEELAGARIIVMTSEMTDSRTRRMETERNYWLMEVGLVIVDETHILSTSRGHPVESGLMRFTTLNKAARIVCLSATMPNVNELGHWLTTLNGKPTRVIYSTWRPVTLEMHYNEYVIPLDYRGRASYYETVAKKKRMAIDIVKSKPDEKFLVFCHDKTTGNSLVRALKDEGIDALFHNADLDLEERLETETEFARRTGGLRVLVSTSTLAWGRNLPARNVVIVGVHRGLQEVDELDIIQMAGRAGRYGIDPEGHVYLIIPEGTTASWQEIFLHPRPVTSVMKDHDTLAFHVLAEIQNRVITDARTLLKWYSRSLAKLQDMLFNLDDAAGLLKDLETMQMVINRGTYYALTGLGKVSSWLYYSPYDVYSWYSNFGLIFTGRLPDGTTLEVPPEVDDLSIAWALTDLPSWDWHYCPKEVQPECDELRWKLRNRGINATDAVHFTLAAVNCLTGKDNEGVLKADARAIRYDVRRITQALSLIDSMHGNWNKKIFWKALPYRVLYGIPEQMVDLVRLPGIGGVKAKKLWDHGVKTLEDVTQKGDVLKKLFAPVVVKKLQKDARELINKSGKDNDQEEEVI